jgi:hypothetical protein
MVLSASMTLVACSTTDEEEAPPADEGQNLDDLEDDLQDLPI